MRRKLPTQSDCLSDIRHSPRPFGTAFLGTLVQLFSSRAPHILASLPGQKCRFQSRLNLEQ